MTQIDTVSKRSKLVPRKNPYWHGVSGGRGGVSLGYRRAAKGPGTWIAKIVIDGHRLEEKIGLADDDGAAVGALNFKAAIVSALEWSRRQNATIAARLDDGDGGKRPTVATAIERYVAARTRRSAQDGKNASGRLAKHVLADEAFSNLPLSKLRAGTIEAWRSRLHIADVGQPAADEATTRPISRSTLNRLLNDLRAALNASAEVHHRELPANLPAEIRIGTRAEAVIGTARKQLLTDKQIRSVVEAAFAIEADGDFGRLILLAAATGARYSQLAGLTVGSVQAPQRRLMMPGSKKGRGATSKPAVAIPLADDVLDRLAPALADRHEDEPLLTRWAYKNIGPFRWEKDRRRPLGPANEIDKQWAAVIACAELPPKTVMYALRHSSIVRSLRAGLPVRLVASLHDTSTAMIERHYSAFIVDMTEDLARRAMLSMGR